MGEVSMEDTPFGPDYVIGESDFLAELESLQKRYEPQPEKNEPGTLWVFVANVHVRFHATVSTIRVGGRKIYLFPRRGSPSDEIHSGIDVSLPPKEGFARYLRKRDGKGGIALAMIYDLKPQWPAGPEWGIPEDQATFAVATNRELLAALGYGTHLM